MKSFHIVSATSLTSALRKIQVLITNLVMKKNKPEETGYTGDHASAATNQQH